MNAPGAADIIPIGGISPITSFPKIFPEPNNSLMNATNMITTPYPKPFEIPSNNDKNTPFLDAKDSALAKIIQFTTIRGTNAPNELYNAGTNASSIIETNVTNVAITTIYAGILTLSGIKFLSNDITMFEQIKTNVNAAVIPIAFSTDVDTPSTEHKPTNWIKTGLFLRMLLLKTLAALPFSIISLLF